MRDLINIVVNLTEAAVGLSAGEITKYDWRFDKFIDKIKNKEPFTTIDGAEVTIDPREAKRFLDMQQAEEFKGTLKARTTDGQEIPLSKLAKTTEFGGAAVAAGQDPSLGGKEGLIVKPSQIGITDKNIPAMDLYDVLENNQALQATDYGKVIINLASYIVSGEYVMLPEEYKNKDKDKVRKAIVDYAGEYLGVLALLYDRSRFPRKNQFLEWLGTDIGSLTLNFPSKANTNLADSYATITNPNTSHTLNISSKGTGGGAAPAISGLKVPDHIRTNPAYSNAVEFIDICQKQSTLQQPFSAMDMLYRINPKSIDKKWHSYLPFATKNPNLIRYAKQSIDSKKSKNPIQLPEKYKKIADSVRGSGTEGGKVIYAMKKEVADSINHKDGLPEFKDAILQILEMNFIQQYCDYTNGELKFATQWPAKLDGNVTVENKSTTNEPTAGGFSFKLGRTDSSVSSEPDEPEVDTVDPVTQEVEPELEKAASSIAGEPTFNAPQQPEPVQRINKPTDVGRKKRK